MSKKRYIVHYKTVSIVLFFLNMLLIVAVYLCQNNAEYFHSKHYPEEIQIFLGTNSIVYSIVYLQSTISIFGHKSTAISVQSCYP